MPSSGSMWHKPCNHLHITKTYCKTTNIISVALSGVYVLIAIGAVMMFVGFLGCYGAIQESQCLLGTVSITQ